MQLIISSEHVPVKMSLSIYECKSEAEMFVDLYEEYSFHLTNGVTSRQIHSVQIQIWPFNR